MSEIVKIVADSAGGFIEGVEYVPFGINLKNDSSRTWLDTKDLTEEDEEELTLLNKIPGNLTTSQPNKSQFKQKIMEVLASDADRIVGLNLNRNFSGSYNEQLAAAEEVNLEYGEKDKVIVADTLGISSILMFQEEAALKAAQQGKSAEEIKDIVENLRDHTHIAQVFNRLRHLILSGRADEAVTDILGERQLEKRLARLEVLENLGICAVIGLDEEKQKIKKFGVRPGGLAMKLAFKKLAVQAQDSEVELIVTHYGVEEDKIARFEKNASKYLKNIEKQKRVKLPWVLRIHAGEGSLGGCILIKNNTQSEQ